MTYIEGVIKMKKVRGLVVVVLVGVTISFGGIHWTQNTNYAVLANQNDSIAEETKFQLTEEEAALVVDSGEKKVIMTDLGLT
jgi:hypothetical protein